MLGRITFFVAVQRQYTYRNAQAGSNTQIVCEHSYSSDATQYIENKQEVKDKLFHVGNGVKD